MHMIVRFLGALAPIALGACTTPQQLADEGQLEEASRIVDPSDNDALAYVALAVAREVEAEVVLWPLDDAELFAALGFVPERFASEEALLVYWRSLAGELPGDRLGLRVGLQGYSGPRAVADVVQPPPRPGPGTDSSATSSLAGLFVDVGAALADKLMPGVRESVSSLFRGGADSSGPGPDQADVRRRGLALRRLERLLALGDAGPGKRRWGFKVVTGTPPETVAVDTTLWVEWSDVWSPSYDPPDFSAPSEGGVRQRVRALSSCGPLVLRSLDTPAWAIDTTGAAAVTDECRRAISLTADPESYFDRGLVLAHADHRPEAATDFARALELGGPSVVYYALWSVAMGQPASALEPHTNAPWPGPICRLWLARTTFDQLLAEAQSVPDERAQRGRVCEAHTYAGLLAELKGDGAAALAHYEAAVETARTDFIEFTWAKARLAKR